MVHNLKRMPLLITVGSDFGQIYPKFQFRPLNIEDQVLKTDAVVKPTECHNRKNHRFGVFRFKNEI